MTVLEVDEGTAPGPADVGAEVDAADAVPTGPPAPSRGRRRLRIAVRALVVAALVALVTATVLVRRDLDDRRADASRAAAAEDRLAQARADAAHLAAAVVVELEQGRADAEVSAAARTTQVARLADLGLTEDEMEAALEEARASTTATEEERDALGGHGRAPGPGGRRAAVLPRRGPPGRRRRLPRRQPGGRRGPRHPRDLPGPGHRPVDAVRRALRRWGPWVLALVVAATCTATIVITLQDRADVVAAEQASLTDGATAARAAAADLSRTAELTRTLEEVRAASATDVRAARRDTEVVDQVTALRQRLEDAQGAILDDQQVSASQRVQLDALGGCVATLDLVRTSLAAGDTRAATAHLAAGRGACARAEEVTDGIVDAVHPFDFPDPDVVEVDGTYYAFGTNGPGGTIQVLSSTDLQDWAVRGSALPDVAGWARKGETWAPAVLRTYRGYLMYYTVRHRDWGVQCLSVAYAESPAGPYADTSRVPITCQTDFGGSIDPSPYVGEDGTPYLTWKSEGETVGSQSVLWGARLDPSGRAIVGASIPLLTVDRPWEGRVVEAPDMQRVGGQWILLYSGADWRTSGYATGFARCLGPLGPCAKPADNLVLQTTDAVQGPGGPSVFRTRGGRVMVAYAGWDAGAVGPPEPRRLHLAELHMTPDSLTAT